MVDDVRARGTRKAPEIRQELLELLGRKDLDARELLEQLERLAREYAFDGLTWLFGPELYTRNRVLFRPFLLSHFSTVAFERPWVWTNVDWKPELEAWLRQVDEADDVELFRRLYDWKHRRDRQSHKAWNEEVLRRARSAADRHRRGLELSKMESWRPLSEETAVELYHLDRTLAGPFILKHLPVAYSVWGGERRSLWEQLSRTLREADDEELYFALYRRQVPLKQWVADVTELARSSRSSGGPHLKEMKTSRSAPSESASPAASFPDGKGRRVRDDELRAGDNLVSELRKRHPEGWGLDLGEGFYRLVEARGRDVFPYVLPELHRLARGLFKGSFRKLMELARQRQWFDLWSALLRTCASNDEFESEVKAVLNGGLSDHDKERRLALLGGVGEEWNFGPFSMARVRPLKDALAQALYARFPELLRGPLKANLVAGYWESYPGLLDRAIAAGDEELLDFLASRLVSRSGGWFTKQVMAQADKLADYYKDQPVRRAVAVLGQVPAYVLWDYSGLIRTNRLARLLYERSVSSYLEDAAALRDLMEAPEIHAQVLAYRALALDDPRARELAAANLDLLLGTLLRPLHRRTRLVAFQALANAAAFDVESARRVHSRAREALDLPDKRYPKDELVGLIGSILWKWPELRSPEEEPVVYA